MHLGGEVGYPSGKPDRGSDPVGSFGTGRCGLGGEWLERVGQALQLELRAQHVM